MNTDADLKGLLEAAFPLRDEFSLDWEDVLQRAPRPSASLHASASSNGTRTLLGKDAARRVSRGRLWSRRRLGVVVALVASAALVAAVTPAGSAIERTFTDFADWLSGEPGTPASSAEQRAFNRAIRSWNGFPQGTQLRQLVQTRSGGATFALYGFRGAGTLCLRLVVSGSVSTRQFACPPLSALRATTQPALVVVADYDVGVSRRPTPPAPLPILRVRPPAAAVTLGIVADGVQHVELHYSNGTTGQAAVNGDAFLAVNNDPPAGERLTGVYAIAGGKRVAVPFVSPPSFDFWSPSWPITVGPQLTAHGPARVQRVVHGDGIGWLNRREPVRVPVPKTVHDSVGVLSNVIFAREITPNPSAPERMVVSVRPAGANYGRLSAQDLICVDVVGGPYTGGGAGGGCWFAERIFSTAPFSEGVDNNEGGQYVTLAGLASDTVARLTLFLGSGQQLRVPLHDNGYIVEAATTDYPLRLVAYDSQGLVIGVHTLNGNQQIRPKLPRRLQPVANAHWRSLTQNSAGHIYVAPSTGGGTCYAITFSNRSEGLQCLPPLPPTETTYTVGGDKHGARLTVHTGSAITRVVVHYRNGRAQTLIPTDGIAIALLPATTGAIGFLRTISSITGYDAHGHAYAHKTILANTSGGSGTIDGLTPTSISIGPTPAQQEAHHAAAPATGTCRITANSPPLSGFHVGDHVQYLCRSEVLTLIGHSTQGTLWINRTVLIEGAISKLTPTAIWIRNEGEATPGEPTPISTCAIAPNSPKPRSYRTGEQVQAFCTHSTLTGINRASPPA